MVTMILALFLGLAGAAQVILLLITDSNVNDYLIPLMIYYFGALPTMLSLPLTIYTPLLRSGKESFMPAVSGVIHAGLHLVCCCTVMSKYLPY